MERRSQGGEGACVCLELSAPLHPFIVVVATCNDSSHLTRKQRMRKEPFLLVLPVNRGQPQVRLDVRCVVGVRVFVCVCVGGGGWGVGRAG